MSATAVPGFEAAGIACGIKPDGVPDLALVATANRQPVTAAGVFTTNRVAAAPVQVSREHLGDGRAVAVILNSGNANAATGEPGRRHARRMCELTALELRCAPADVLVCSTGLIGYPLPMAPIEAGVPKLVAALGSDEAAGFAAADAILTTDTVRKTAEFHVLGDGRGVVAGFAKGAAMLSPAMATMLAVVVTDLAVTPSALDAALQSAVDASFHSLVVDGCTSTNDTVLVLASGTAGNPPIPEAGEAYEELEASLAIVCSDLALAMASDAEGKTRTARVNVHGAASGDDARRAARAVASSQLVQCSLNGSDPYWGRILSELGASGAELDPERVDISYGGVVVCRDGIAAEHDRAAVAEVMARDHIDISCNLFQGDGAASVVFTDLSHTYIDENRTTS